VLANQSSPNRLVAAVAQIPLGEYGGLAVIRGKLDDKDPDRRRLAARALGDIGDPGSLDALLELARDKDWTVRIAAAGAIVAIVGLDPKVLAQASVDWTKDALDSQDLAVRKAAAGVLADIPAKEAVPLLAKAIADPDANVRLAATRSAGKIKTADAAGKVAVALKTEVDPRVKEQAVKALGEIGTVAGPAAHDTLAELSNEAGRLGVLAAGSLIAVGDTAGAARLEAAVGDHQVGIRLAAVEAASSAGNAVVVPTLKIGVGDKVFEIRFAAAEGLASFIAEKQAALPVLTAALDNRDAGVVGRAIAALTRLGEKIKDTVRTPADMLDSTDPRQRLAAVPVVRAMAVGDAVPLLRRLVADADQEVRHAGVDAIEDIVGKDKDQAIKLYKPLVNDVDPVVRSKALGQLSRIAPPLQQPAQAAQAAPPPTPPTPPTPTLDPRVKEASDAAKAAAAEAQEAADAVEAQITELGKTTAARTRDDAMLDHVKKLKAGFDAATAKLDTVAEKAEAAAKAVEVIAAASPSDEASKLVAEARELAQHAREAATTARGKLPAAEQQADGFIKDETGDPQNQIVLAGLDIRNGNYAAARANLDKAQKLLQKTGEHIPALDDLYSQVFLGLAQATQAPTARHKLLQRAAAACQRFIQVGAGVKVAEAKERLAEINGELEKSGAQ
jgi:HEAT repeat protein